MIEMAVREHQAAIRRHEARKSARTPRCLLRESDLLVDHVEELVLSAVPATPGGLVPHLRRFLHEVDPQLLSRLGSGRDPELVLDVMFRAQKVLMRRSMHSRCGLVRVTG